MQTGKKKKLIIANSILLLFLMIGFVFAWFASNYSNEVDSNQIEVMADNSLQLSLTGNENDWKSNVNLTTDNYSSDWFNTIKFTDITGSGDGNFLRPALMQGDNMAYVNPAEEWSTPIKNEIDGDYVSFTLYMRSKDPLKVKLGDGSYVKPADESLKGSGVINPSGGTGAYKYSKDIVVGALRVSVKKPDNSFFTWIPRPDIYVNPDETGQITFNNINLNQVSGPSFTHNYYPARQESPVQLDPDQTVTGNITEKNEQILVTLNGQKDSNGYYTNQVDINIWLEGTDNEARRAFVGGKFNVYLNIISEDTTE